jgi:hypothetical protein
MSTFHLRVGTTVSLMIVLAVGLGLPPPAAAQAPAWPDWMEPQALNIVDMAGQVPDEVLSGMTIAWDGGGVVRFVSSEVDGDWLRIHVRLDTRRLRSGSGWVTQFGLLGQRPVVDHVSSTAPESWVRVYEGSREVTSELLHCTYVVPPRSSPSTDASVWTRYPENVRIIYPADMPLGTHGRYVPANTGGEVALPGDRPVLTATFTVRRPAAARVTYLGTQDASFQSFIGPCSDGDMGGFGALVNQLRALTGGAVRHPRIGLNIPAGANYIAFNYRPMDYDIYTVADYDVHDPNSNLFRPIAGTVRLAPDEGMLSQNLNHGGAFPLLAAWQDADQSAGPYLSLLPPVDRITPPEYFVLPGTPYNACFRDGGCSTDLLQSIYNDSEPIHIVYLKVTPTITDQRPIPLKAADDPRSPAMGITATQEAAAAVAAVPAATGRFRVYLPGLSRQVPLWTDVPRPAGIFEPTSGRMVGYLP